ncbi:hypothetical protein ACNKHX_19735 [Shigella flexneri]
MSALARMQHRGGVSGRRQDQATAAVCCCKTRQLLQSCRRKERG